MLLVELEEFLAMQEQTTMVSVKSPGVHSAERRHSAGSSGKQENTYGFFALNTSVFVYIYILYLY